MPVFYHSLTNLNVLASSTFSAVEIANLHDRATRLWHDDTSNIVTTSQPFYDTVVTQHRANFDLWHIEDRARAPHATDHDIARQSNAPSMK